MAMPSGRRSSDPSPLPERQRNAAQQRRHRGHHDGAEAQQAGFVNRIRRVLPVLALRLQREVDDQIPFFFTMPISRMMPMMATTLRSWPKRISASSAPTPAEGSVDRIVMG